MKPQVIVHIIGHESAFNKPSLSTRNAIFKAKLDRRRGEILFYLLYYYLFYISPRNISSVVLY